MKKSPTSKVSKTDWPRVRKLKDKGIKTSAEHPVAKVKHIVRGIVRQGLKPVSPKVSISIRIDSDVLEWFKSRGPGYQARINAALRAFMEASR